MPTNQATAVEFLVPQDMAEIIQAQPDLDVKSVTKVADEELKFGIVELVAVYVVSRTVLSITQTAIVINKMLKDSKQAESKAYIRSPSGRDTIVISPDDNEDQIERNVTKVYG